MANKRWEKSGDLHELHFERFYDDEVIAIIKTDTDGDFCVTSAELDVKDQFLFISDELNARREVERMIEDHYLSEMQYYEYLYKKFVEQP